MEHAALGCDVLVLDLGLIAELPSTRAVAQDKQRPQAICPPASHAINRMKAATRVCGLVARHIEQQHGEQHSKQQHREQQHREQQPHLV